MPDITKQELLEAIREGVQDAMWQMITNATESPCGDFYHTVKEGVIEAIGKSCDIRLNVGIAKGE